MAIGFGRVEFIKRSQGRNACQLSAYLSRFRIFFEGNCVLAPRLYDFSHREDVYHHEIILPEGADENLKIPEVLWNLAEKKEVRKDAQVSMHLVLALPDDKEITPEERVELARNYIKKHYDGLVAELVIHPPERTIEFTEENEVLGIPKGVKGTVIEQKGENYIVSLPKGVRPNPFVEIGVNYPGMSVQEHNWHAHGQLSTRRLKDNGKEFEDYKATDLMPVIKKGKVVDGLDVGKLWAQHQNEFFLSKGLALKVEDNGLIAQEHLGPVRMRGRAYALLEEHEKRLERNALAASDPRNILEAIIDRQSVFTKDDVERFMLKHVPEDKIQEVKEGFWKLEDIVQLKSKETKEWTSEFSSLGVIKEEQHILRLANRIYEKPTRAISDKIQNAYASGLSEEQKEAYHNILNGKGLSCIQGYAGTGKSYLLKALKDAYEERGLIVRSFGPDNATANVLNEQGFTNSENIYRFLFSTKHGHKVLHKGFEIWMLDEAGKLGNKPLLEFLKLAEKSGTKVILAGDAAQLSAVERGGVFKYFCEKYGSQVLQDIQRQKDATSRAMAKDLAKGNIGFALDKLNSLGGIHWSLTRRESIKNLVTQWAIDHRNESLSTDSSLIIAGSHREVRAINEMVRLVRQGRGEIGEKEFACETVHGTIYVSEGDRIEFCKNEKDLRIQNRMSGVLIKAEESSFSVAIQENGKKTRVVYFDPKKFHGFQLGYASTCNRAQGRTLKNAYFLHSSYLNKQMAYVALTRHVNVAKYFVSKEEAFCLSDLKRQALKDFSKKTTLEYTNTMEIEKVLAQAKRALEIQNLKRSDQLSERFKGEVLNIWDQLSEKAGAQVEKYQDRELSEYFFNREKEKTRLLSIEKTEQTSNPNIAQADQIQSREVAQEILKDDGQYFYAPHLSQDKLYQEPIFKDLKSGPTVDNLIYRFVEQGTLASDYREQVENEADQENKSPEETERFKDQQQAAVMRNTYAFLAHYRALSENISLENTYGKSMQQRIDHFCERFNASFQVEKGLKTTEGINELSVSYAKKYDRLLVSSLDLQKEIQIEAALSEKNSEECSKFELWRETCGQRNALAYVLRESLSSQEKSFEDILSEKVLQYANSFEKIFEPKPLVKEGRPLDDQALIAITERYQEAETQTLEAWKKVAIESAVDDKSFEECFEVVEFFKRCGKRNALAFSIQYRLTEKCPDLKEPFLADRLIAFERQKLAFEKSLQKPEIFLSDVTFPTKEIHKLAKRYESFIEKTLEMRRVVACEVGETGKEESDCKSFELWQKECQQRNAFASHLLSSLKEANIEVESLFTQKIASRIRDQAERFDRSFESRVLFKEEAIKLLSPEKISDFTEYETLSKEALALRKIIMTEATVQEIAEKDSDFFADFQAKSLKRNETAFYIGEQYQELKNQVFTKEGIELQAKHAERFEQSLNPYVLTHQKDYLFKEKIQKYQREIGTVLELRKDVVLADHLDLSEVFSVIAHEAKRRNKTAYELKSELEKNEINLQELFTDRGYHGLCLHAQKHLESLDKKDDHLFFKPKFSDHISEEDKKLLLRYEISYEQSLEAQQMLLEEVKNSPDEKVHTLASFKAKTDVEKTRNILAAAIIFRLNEAQVKVPQVFNNKGERLLKLYASNFEKSFQLHSFLKEGAHLPKEHASLLEDYSDLLKKTLTIQKRIALESVINSSVEAEHQDYNDLKNLLAQKNAFAKEVQEKLGDGIIDEIFTERGSKVLSTQSQEIETYIEKAINEEILEKIQETEASEKASCEKTKLVNQYFRQAAKASELKEVVEVERSDHPNTQNIPHFQKWQKACAQRNESAYQAKSQLSNEELVARAGEKSTFYIETHAKKHEEILEAQRQRELQAEKLKDLDGQLASYIEPLLYKLFPDGPSKKTGREYRFGAKGSLLVNHNGDKAGQFYDFERGEGGGPLKLIARELNLDQAEARKWAAEFLGVANEIKLPATFKKPSLSPDKDSDWVSIKPDPNVPAPKFENHGKLHHYYKEVMRHAYRDEKGTLLYYVLRLQNKEDPSQKSTPPLSYGYYKNNPERLIWELRGYKDESGKKPLYNLHELMEKPLAPVLVVEGEKTADKALEKFPDRDFICMTWSGGASSVSKADWSPLFGREVVVWPDNDEAGFRAANQVCDELKKVCVSKVCMIERPELFAKLPEKWDLADPLPEGVDHSSLSFHLMDNRKDRLQKIVFEKIELNQCTSPEKLRTAHLLYHFEKRIEEKIQEELSQDLSLSQKEQVWRGYGMQAIDLLEQKDTIYEKICSDPQVNASGKLAERLTFQMQLFEAKNGYPPESRQILQLKEAILEYTKDMNFLKDSSVDQVIKDLAIDRSLKSVCEKKLKGHEVSKDERHSFECAVRKETAEISKLRELEIIQNQALEKQKSLEISRGVDLSL